MCTCQMVSVTSLTAGSEFTSKRILGLQWPVGLRTMGSNDDSVSIVLTSKPNASESWNATSRDDPWNLRFECDIPLLLFIRLRGIGPG
jgi:hypothetical protein